jgi:hypothetical protein
LLAKIKMLEIVADTHESYRNDRSKESHNGNHVFWRGRKIKIPDWQYNAGGGPTEYTPEKVISTLDFYYRMLTKGDLEEIKTEEQEERHHKSLLDAAITLSIREKVCTLKDLQSLQANRKVYNNQKL